MGPSLSAPRGVPPSAWASSRSLPGRQRPERQLCCSAGRRRRGARKMGSWLRLRCDSRAAAAATGGSGLRSTSASTLSAVRIAPLRSSSSSTHGLRSGQPPMSSRSAALPEPSHLQRSVRVSRKLERAVRLYAAQHRKEPRQAGWMSRHERSPAAGRPRRWSSSSMARGAPEARSPRGRTGRAARSACRWRKLAREMSREPAFAECPTRHGRRTVARGRSDLLEGAAQLLEARPRGNERTVPEPSARRHQEHARCPCRAGAIRSGIPVARAPRRRSADLPRRTPEQSQGQAVEISAQLGLRDEGAGGFLSPCGRALVRAPSPPQVGG